MKTPVEAEAQKKIGFPKREKMEAKMYMEPKGINTSLVDFNNGQVVDVLKKIVYEESSNLSTYNKTLRGSLDV
jgi:hypothetical protein